MLKSRPVTAFSVPALRASAPRAYSAPLARHTLKDEVYTRLCEALMSGEFAPGERLTVRHVAELTRTSIMPVREAFRRLASEGALELTLSGATQVPVIDAAEFEEISALRLRVEGLAVRLAAERISSGEIAEIEATDAVVVAAVKSKDARAEARANEAFHFTIYRAARSQILLRTIQPLWLRVGPVLAVLLNDINVSQPKTRLADMKYHSQLIAALRAGDAEKAEHALQADLGKAAEFYLARLKKRASLPIR